MKGAADNALSYRKKDTLKTAAPEKSGGFSFLGFVMVIFEPRINHT
jgi:hypothetical protein